MVDGSALARSLPPMDCMERTTSRRRSAVADVDLEWRKDGAATQPSPKLCAWPSLNPARYTERTVRYSAPLSSFDDFRMRCHGGWDGHGLFFFRPNALYIEHDKGLVGNGRWEPGVAWRRLSRRRGARPASPSCAWQGGVGRSRGVASRSSCPWYVYRNVRNHAYRHVFRHVY